MRLASLDLNLLVALDALLQEGSVTRAAERLHLSQPALSASLARLRRHFGDELLERVGNHSELTPLAVQLRERTTLALEGVERVFASQQGFDPATSEREFRLLTSDYAVAVLGERLCALVAERAPGVRLRLRLHTPEVIDRAHDELRAVDGLIMPHGFLTELASERLFEDEWACLVATDNPLVGEALTMEDLSRLPWAVTYYGPTAFTPAARQLQMLGVEARVQVVVESFLALPHVVAGSSRIALVQRRLAGRMVAAGGLRVLPCPYDAVRLVEALWWHGMYDRDPGHRWLRETVLDAAAGLDASSRPMPALSDSDW
jgi:DNA-binding transcriptional LysR family regulator